MMLRVSSFLTKRPPKRSIKTDKIQADVKGKQDAKIKVEQRLLGKHKPHTPKIILKEKGNKGNRKGRRKTLQ